jgi:hypothetical protein
MPFFRTNLISRILAVVALLLFAFITTTPAAYSAGPQQAASLEDLWIDMRIGPPLISLFNEAAQAGDIARVDHPSQVEQLSEIEDGRKLVIFKSVEETEQFLPDIAGEIDIIGYNLEHGQTTPENEKNDPVAAIQKMRELADEYGLELAFGPDHDFALSHGVQMAPYADIFVLQIQRQQTNPEIVNDFVEPLVPQLRQANPDLQVSVQVRTEGSVDEIIKLLEDLKEYLDGVSILTSPDTVDVAWELTTALRPYVQSPSPGLDQAWIYIPVAAGLAGGAYLLYRHYRPR